LATTLFLGGWRAPFPISLIPGVNEGWIPLIWFFSKIAVFLFIFIWIRGTLPRFRYDQFMNLGWKILIPASLAWIAIVAITRGLRNSLDLPTGQTIAFLGLPLIAVALAVFIADWRKDIAEVAKEELIVEITEVNPFAGGHPVPPLPGQVLVEPNANKQGVLNG
jgi:NADH-quinone oxidoreductase subunit H